MSSEVETSLAILRFSDSRTRSEWQNNGPDALEVTVHNYRGSGFWLAGTAGDSLPATFRRSHKAQVEGSIGSYL